MRAMSTFNAGAKAPGETPVGKPNKKKIKVEGDALQPLFLQFYFFFPHSIKSDNRLTENVKKSMEPYVKKSYFPIYCLTAKVLIKRFSFSDLPTNVLRCIVNTAITMVQRTFLQQLEVD